MVQQGNQEVPLLLGTTGVTPVIKGQSWAIIAKQLGIIGPYSHTAAGVVAASLIAVRHGNQEVNLALAQWLHGGDAEETWERIDRHLDLQEFIPAKMEFLKWDIGLRRLLIQALTPLVSEPEDLLGDICLASHALDDPKEAGQIFTPSWLSKIVARDALGHWRRLHRDGGQPGLIGDVSCGAGVFLAAVRRTFGPDTQVIGIDSDPACVAYAKLLGKATGQQWQLSSFDPLLGSISHEQWRGVSDEIPREGYDILIGNPPYIRSQNLDKDYRDVLKSAYPDMSSGNFDLSIFFLDHAIKALAPGGLASYITSRKFMVSSYGRAICKKLGSDVRVINIVDFEDHQVFQGRTTYTCILTFAKLLPAKKFTISRFNGDFQNGQQLSRGKTESLPIERLKTHPWNFATGLDRDALVKLNNTRHPLMTQIFDDVLQGLRTGANSVFLIDSSESPDIEPEILRPYVSGHDIRRCKIVNGHRQLLYPYYQEKSGEVRLYPETELQLTFPKSWHYLSDHQQQLKERKLDGNRAWYSYSRSQNLEVPWTPKLMIREMMPRSEFAADTAGELAYSSGYALVAGDMTGEDMRMWAAILNTPTMEFSLRHNGTELHSGWFRVLKHHLQITRLPALSQDARDKALALSAKLHDQPDIVSDWVELDNIVAKSFGLNSAERQAINAYLSNCYSRSMPASGKGENEAIAECEWNVSLRSRSIYEPVRLEKYDQLHIERTDLRRSVTFQINKTLPIHRWYSFSQGFSEPLVLNLIEELSLRPPMTVLDPFAGAGTSLVVCKRSNLGSIGIEISPFLSWVTKLKVFPWKVEEIGSLVKMAEEARPIPADPEGMMFLSYLSKAYAPKVLAQLVGINRWIDGLDVNAHDKCFLQFGLISILEEVSQIRKHGSHYRYMLRTENAGLQKLNTQMFSPNQDVMLQYRQRLRQMLVDVESCEVLAHDPICQVICGDVRNIPISSSSIDAVITSPPYLNRNVYLAQQKAEMSFLHMVESYEGYRSLVRRTFRSHVEAEFDLQPSSKFPEVRKILDAISLTENNNPKIPHMIAGYFEDMDAALSELSRVMKPGATAAFVVGNSRWGGVVVPVDHILLMIAERHNFQPMKVLVTREKGNSPQQMRKYGRIPVRESVVVFRKPS